MSGSVYIAQCTNNDYDDGTTNIILETLNGQAAVDAVLAAMMACNGWWGETFEIIRYDVEGYKLTKWVLPFRDDQPRHAVSALQSNMVPRMGTWKQEELAR